jgi:hypothetical protein
VADPYLLPGSDVLRNRCGITDRAVLAEFELKASLDRVVELAANPVAGSFDLPHLCAIHEFFAIGTAVRPIREDHNIPVPQLVLGLDR